VTVTVIVELSIMVAAGSSGGVVASGWVGVEEAVVGSEGGSDSSIPAPAAGLTWKDSVDSVREMMTSKWIENMEMMRNSLPFRRRDNLPPPPRYFWLEHSLSLPEERYGPDEALIWLFIPPINDEKNG